MPKIRKNNRHIVLCINHADHILEKAVPAETVTTMSQNSEWNAITAVTPPNKETQAAPSFLPATGIPVRVYFCQVCGYVESYVGAIANPEVWRQ